MAALSLSSLKAYVGGGAPRALHPSTVLLDVEHSLIQQRFVEIPFDVSWSVLQVQEKVHQLCGTQVEHMQLHLHGPQGPLLHPPQATLASFGVRGGGSSSGGARLLYVKDLDPFALGRGGGLHDVSQVQKYVMSDEQYRQRDNTYHSFKEKQKALDPAWRSIYEKKKTEGAAAQGVQVEEESLEEVRRRIALHSRCQITPGERRGTVRYVGPVPELRAPSSAASASAPVWVGVELDEPLGKHAGAAGGHSYFACRDKHGSFVRASNVQTGTFPERDPFEDDDDDDNEQALDKDEEQREKVGDRHEHAGEPLYAAPHATGAEESTGLYEEI